MNSLILPLLAANDFLPFCIGLYGIFLFLPMTKTFSTEFSQAFFVNISIFVAYNLMMGLTGGIDNAAHIGGLVCGLLFGFLWRISLKREAVLY